ncbi:MAG: hypothetical protein KDG55_05305 [Rhodocyclaceae bacterium]|nr:hypothetical protein [Rhodocyclaceae bacterium]
MNDVFAVTGRAAGVLGILICALACGLRLAGMYTIAGVEAITLLQLGIAAIVTGCFLLLWSLSRQGKG